MDEKFEGVYGLTLLPFLILPITSCLVHVCACGCCVYLQPKFAASLQILKVEIGGDSQSSGK